MFFEVDFLRKLLLCAAAVPATVETILVLVPLSLTRISNSWDGTTVADRERCINRMPLNWKQDQVLLSSVCCFYGEDIYGGL